jgi:hypothetical protein
VLSFATGWCTVFGCEHIVPILQKGIVRVNIDQIIS